MAAAVMLIVDREGVPATVHLVRCRDGREIPARSRDEALTIAIEETRAGR